MWVSVRHTNLGVVSRAFDPKGTISGIYDWIGSLCPTPEHFRLIAFPSSTLFPRRPNHDSSEHHSQHDGGERTHTALQG